MTGGAHDHIARRPIAETCIDIVIPVYNEGDNLESSVRKLQKYLSEDFPFRAAVTIADNASTDQTLQIARDLATELPGVSVVHLDEKGRGRALKAAWLASRADVVVYMDVDLSTGLDALLPLVAPLVTGHSDLAIGTRLAPGARVVRGPKREVISRCYNTILRTVLRNNFSDAQCGFKAMRTPMAQALLPLVEDGAWFFDTELLLLAERNGLRVHEVPVDWIDDPDSKVDVASTAVADLKGLWRVIRSLAHGGGRIDGPTDTLGLGGDFARFAGIGLLSTIAWLGLLLVLRPSLGLLAANLVATCLCAVSNLVAHRFLNVGAPRRPDRDLGLVALGSGLAFLGATTLALLGCSKLTNALALQLAAAVAAGAVVSAGRFIALRALLVTRFDTSADRRRAPVADRPVAL
ncbi:MAG TPA: dolichyl-phosphate beta-glucosyltransferase [Acidimicrobiales bacterium]|jgi:hypothetical protein|nr:dolichyl-phosphate beta-glucosyltransferase [Acidimicrobiales bacterium]